MGSWPLIALAVALLAEALLAVHASEARSKVEVHNEEGTASLQTLIQGEVERFGRTAATVSNSLKSHNLKGAHRRERHSHHKADLKAQRKARLRAMSLEAVSAKLQLQERQPLLYTPKIGVANVTAPTPFPPLPPVVDAWNMYQPLDTNLGERIVSGFEFAPTLTPPPEQAAMNLAFGCPVLLGWPLEVTIETPTPCTDVQTAGKWNVSDAGEILGWEETCSLKELKTTPTVVYTMPNGDHFGHSQMRTTIRGVVMEIYDCGLNLIHTVEEKVFHQTGPPNQEVCDRYGSCDGITWLQYFIYDGNGAVVGMTAYLNLFQASWTIADGGGVPIATVTKSGWSPVDRSCSNETRTWQIHYNGGAAGYWSSPQNKWPIAAMMTMLSMRDTYRLPNGMVTMSKCAARKSLSYLIILVVLSIILFIALMIFLTVLPEVRTNCLRMEWRLCPKRMSKPTFWDA
eukprot:gnl/TRDRNA2_/TRDRNA2_55179_c0_seq2.p1 gnl/TRDRNA2_/TRDRNA2_55179_c0~~gnl/TRDRNA2_/TRDRNA2_55179_c0_seq2.p1  ORF type:complete len:457 (-),score=59.12 gnl/TRDRNA2_/TRDRNA2_55179_c0_seq2:168-1538(-)